MKNFFVKCIVSLLLINSLVSPAYATGQQLYWGYQLTATNNTAITNNLDVDGSTTLDTTTIEEGLTVNDAGADYDTRIEGDNDANLFFTDAGNDKVGIGTNTPAGKFEVYESSSLGGVAHYGTGIDDMTNSGTYSGDPQITYKVEISGTGTPDTITWYEDNNPQGVDVITGGAQLLSNGVYITFAATTGHTKNDFWLFNVYPERKLVLNDSGEVRIGIYQELSLGGATGITTNNNDLNLDSGPNGMNFDAGNDLDFTSSDNGMNFTLGGGAGDDFIVDTNTLVVESDNDRVGIGTAAPNDIFQVVDRIFFDTTNYNTAFGQNALNDDTGTGVTAIGYQSLYTNDAGGTYNTGVGSQSLLSNSTGDYNTGIGYQAGDTITTGTYNTFLGYGADATGNSLTNAMALGNGASVDEDNKVVIGNDSVGTIGGYADWSNYSDRRTKENIADFNDVGLEFINKLRPVEYNFISQPGKTKHGLIAQEVESALNDLGVDFSGVVAPANPSNNYMISYSQFTIPLTNAIQELDLKFGETMKVDSNGNVNMGLTKPGSIASKANEGGNLTTGTYYYRVTAINGATESATSEETFTTVDGTDMKTIDIRWAPVADAISYRIYKGTSSGNQTVYFTTNQTSFSDTGGGSTIGTPNPSTNAETNRLSINDNSWITGGNLGIGTKTPDAKLDVDGGIRTALVTSDPCGTAAYPEGTMFYNDTSNYYCFCDGSGRGVRMQNPSGLCF